MVRLAIGATQVVFEGVPTYPNAGRFWDMIAKHKVTMFYTAPTAIRSLIKVAEADPEVHPKSFDLSTLRMLGTVGEPINPEAWMWYLRERRRRPLPGRRYLVADRNGRPHDHAAAGRDAAGAGFVHAAAAGHHGGGRRRNRSGRAERAGRHSGHQASVAVDAAQRVGRSGALSRRATSPKNSAASCISPATARCATRTPATSRSWAVSTTC